MIGFVSVLRELSIWVYIEVNVVCQLNKVVWDIPLRLFIFLLPFMAWNITQVFVESLPHLSPCPLTFLQFVAGPDLKPEALFDIMSILHDCAIQTENLWIGYYFKFLMTLLSKFRVFPGISHQYLSLASSYFSSNE